MMAEPQTQLAPRDQYNAFVDRLTTQVIAAMPLTVPDADLKRARARFRVAFSADAQQALQECTPESVARAIVLSAMSGLYPGGPRPDVWLIPRRNKHRGNQLEANWQMSFRGFIRLARRAYWELEPLLVFEGEKFEIHEGDKTAIVHVRNLDLPKTWDSLRYGYVRVYPVGKREQARIAYLTKAEIMQRRKKAQDDSIWREWPLEMSYKTLCNYAGNREMFPTDDPARYAMEASEQAEIGSGAASAEMWGSLPAGSKTEGLAARLAAKSTPVVVEVEGRPLDAVEASPQDAGGETSFSSSAGQPGELLSATQVKEVRALVERSKVSLERLEESFGGPLEEVRIPGLSARELEAELVREVKAMVAAREAEGQLPLGEGKK